ncbi:MAG: maleylpyruvate isomerase family mycothiol-dependent enzyme [Acidimicrobiia bacterium]|nr:maleylpyruvate isomerase family mycothiol-dependent enzyme [Acidimicrobiia bacterium]
MSERSQIIANLESVWSSIDEMCSTFSPTDWQVRSLCPDWTLHGVLAHLCAVEFALTGWLPESADSPLPFDRVAPFLAEAATLDGAALLDRFRATIAQRRQELAATDDATFAAGSPTPVGKATYGRFMAVREFDFWVHERDMRVPLGRRGDDGGPAAEMALDEVHQSMGYIVGKRAGAPDGSSVAVRLTGPVEREIFVAVDGRAALVDHLDDPTTTLSTDSLTFMLLACGRIDPAGPIGDGRITWSGDATLGEQVARNLRFTM